MTQPLTQSQFISFELHSLGWKAFQDLCSTIVSEVLGQTVQSFLPTHDGGRDGAFHGVWVPTENQRYEGSFTVQCKFSSNKGHSLTLSGVSDELKKAAGLAERGLSKHYILMTNCKLSGTSEEKIRKAFLSIDQIEYCFILDTIG